MVVEGRRWAWLWVASGVVVALAGAPAWLAAQPVAAQGIFMANGRAATAGGGDKSADARGLHIPQGRQVSFNYQMTDSSGCQWDIQYYGTVGQGTNNAFSGGMYCQINGANVQSTGYGWVNAAGDEIEIGPFQSDVLRCYRRIKVYRDMPLARWLDILENPTSQNITLQVTLYTNRCYTIRSSTSSSGKGTFGPKDWALITESTHPSGSSVLQIVGDQHSKVRPNVQVQSSLVYVRYNLTIPAGKTIVLCSFLSQANTSADHLKMLKTFRAHQALKDLSPGVRKLLVNFGGGGGFDGVDLERSTSGDVVILKSGDPIYGRVTNESFPVTAFFGDCTLAAGQVVGMAAGESPDEPVRFVLTGGQIVSGAAGNAKLKVALPSGGELGIPLEDIRQWSYQISKDRPEGGESSEPYVLLRTGDKLSFDPAGLKLSFRTQHGPLPLEPGDLLEVALDNRGNAVHRAVFLNGSRLAGFLEPEQIELKLKLGRVLRIGSDKVVRMRFAPAEKRDESLTAVLLKNEDELFGQVLDPQIQLVTRYNPIPLRPDNVRSIRQDGQTVVEMWDGTVHKGYLGQAEISFQIVPGPKLSLHTGHIEQIVRPRPLPPEDTRKLVDQLVAQLGAESFKDRQEATEKLMQIKGIGPLLRKYLNHSDPEVRQRIEEILDKAGDGGEPRPGPGRPDVNGQIMLFKN